MAMCLPLTARWYFWIAGIVVTVGLGRLWDGSMSAAETVSRTPRCQVRRTTMILNCPHKWPVRTPAMTAIMICVGMSSCTAPQGRSVESRSSASSIGLQPSSLRAEGGDESGPLAPSEHLRMGLLAVATIVAREPVTIALGSMEEVGYRIRIERWLTAGNRAGFGDVREVALTAMVCCGAVPPSSDEVGRLGVVRLSALLSGPDADHRYEFNYAQQIMDAGGDHIMGAQYYAWYPRQSDGRYGPVMGTVARGSGQPSLVEEYFSEEEILAALR